MISFVGLQSKRHAKIYFGIQNYRLSLKHSNCIIQLDDTNNNKKN